MRGCRMCGVAYSTILRLENTVEPRFKSSV